MSSIPNEVEITITGRDLSGPAFASAASRMAALRAQAEGLRKTLGNLTVGDLDVNKMQASLIALRSKMQALGIADIADINVQPGRIMTQLQLLKRLISQAGISDILDVNVNEASLATQLRKISGVSETIPIKFDLGALPKIPLLGPSQAIHEKFDLTGIGLSQTTIAGIQSLLDDTYKLNAGFGDLRPLLNAIGNGFEFVRGKAVLVGSAVADLANPYLLGARMAIDSVTGRLSAMGTALVNSAVWSRLFTNSVAAGVPVIQAGGAGWAGWTGGITLFGGAIKSLFPQMPVWISHLVSFTAYWHLLAEAIIETAGTLIPAAIAFGVFAAASIPTFQDLFHQVQSVATANSALGESVRPLTGAYQALVAAVQPQVFVLAGEAILEAGHNTGILTTIATGAGKVLDDLGARFVFATTQGGMFNTIAAHAAADLAIWGTGIGNIGGILGGILKVLPGYAQSIGIAFDTVTHVIETLVNSGVGQWLLSVGLAAHGALLYIGLLATAFTVLMTRGLAGLSTLLLNAAVGLERIGASAAATTMLNFATQAERAAALPWGWISVAVAGLGFLIFKLVTAKSAAQQFADSLQQQFTNAPITSLAQDLSSAYGKVQQNLNSADAALNQFTKDNFASIQAAEEQIHKTTGATALLQQYQQLQQNAANYAAALQLVKGDQDIVNQHIQEAAGVFGGTAAAWAILNGAGVTSAQMLDTNKQHWAEAMIEAEAFQQTILIGTGGTQRYSAALNALNFTAGDSKNALGALEGDLQKVTQAEDAVFSTLIGGEQAFITFDQGLAQMAKDAGVSGASINGLNTQSLTLANDFYSTVLPAAQKQIDALVQQNISTGDLTKVIATQAAQLIPYAQNNMAARVAIADLINNALGPGTVSLQTLNTWVKNNQTSMQGYKSIVDATQISASNLAGTLQQQLTAQFQADLLASSGATAQMKVFTNAVVNGGTQTAAFQGARAQLIQDLINTGMNATQAKNYVNNLQNQIDAMHGKTVNIGMNGQGQFTIQQLAAAGGLGIAPGPPPPHASGGMLYGGGGPTADDLVVRASGGEYIVRASSVNKYGVGMLNAINAGTFAGGGLITGNLTPAYISGMYDQFQQRMTDAMISAMQAALKAAEAAAIAAAAKAAAAAAGGGSAGPGGGSASANQALARSLEPQWSSGPQWSAWLSLWNRESGWSQFADTRASGLDPRNASVFAYGIPQARPYSKMPMAGWPADKGGSSNPHAQETWGIGYIAGTYGSPIGAWNHEVSQGWYDNGGWLKPGWNPPMYNGTGRMEHLTPDSGGALCLEVTSGGDSAFEQFMLKMIREFVRIKGGGNVQTAFGRH